MQDNLSKKELHDRGIENAARYIGGCEGCAVLEEVWVCGDVSVDLIVRQYDDLAFIQVQTFEVADDDQGYSEMGEGDWLPVEAAAREYAAGYDGFCSDIRFDLIVFAVFGEHDAQLWYRRGAYRPPE